ncbi:transposase [Streptomyces sp. SAS_276]|uniref:transposase n=1 Tax=Streptomyces sp. SAS_276 TaxID=3412745 RepID=UPI00403C5C1B
MKASPRHEVEESGFHTFWQVQVLLDEGYLGLSRDHRGKALTQPRKLRSGATLPFFEHNERQRHDPSSQRITVEHALADHKRWRQLQRWTYRRDRLPDIYQTIATLVSDRSVTS